MFSTTMTLLNEERQALGYVMIEETPIPEMYPEFAPGPKNEEEARFWHVAVSVYHIYFKGSKPHIEEVDYKWMNANYKHIHGRTDRIYYWQVMGHMKVFDRDDSLPDGSCVDAMI